MGHARTRGTMAAAAVVLAAALPGTASGAVGTNTISAAPTVPVGQQQVGNTADGQRYWRVQLGLGDTVTVGWRNTQAPSASTRQVCLLQPDVTDATYGFDDDRATSRIAQGASGTLAYRATRPGLYVLDFRCDGAQTYDFTVGVTPYPRTGAEVVGGGLIATAPATPPGVRQVGNTEDGQRYWKVQLGLGDVVAVDWRNADAPSGSTRELCLLQPDVTDPTYGFDDDRATSRIASGAAGTLRYRATRPGLYVLDFRCDGTQTFDFAASVTPHGRTGGEVVGAPLIQTAPTVPLGVTHFGDTTDGQRYWRVSTARRGQTIRVAWASLDPPGTETQRLCVVAPGTTDQNYSGSSVLASSDTADGAGRVLRYRALRPGSYILDAGCSNRDVRYSLAATLLDPTTTTASAVALGRGRARVRARVRPAVAGACQLRQGSRVLRRTAARRGVCAFPATRLGAPRRRVAVTVRFVPRGPYTPSSRVVRVRLR